MLSRSASTSTARERVSEQFNLRRNKPQVVPESQAKPQAGVINQGSIDYTLCFVTVVLVLIGVVMIFSASFQHAVSRGLSMFHFLRAQGTFAVVGFGVMFAVSKIPYRLWLRSGWPLYIVSSVMLIYVTIMAEATGGARRWIDLPLLGRFQPSEITKAAIIMLVAYLIFRDRKVLDTWKGFFFMSGVVGFAALLVGLENMSTAIIITLIGMGMIFIASPHITRFVVMGAAGAGAMVTYLAVFSRGFRGARFEAWLDPFSDHLGFGYQTIQSLFAVASGGLFGLGIGQSRQKSFIPEPQHDMIFAIIAEELGFAGAALILTFFGILIWRGIKIAINATDMFGSLVATGIVLMIASQAIINVAVVTNSIPNTGVPMPFISYGGTSLLVTMFLVGVLLNISRYHRDA
ncbi:MAG: putative lipid II flippase FtsW [Defluviitaleaceae bacterium]|nr:putative lipid II flippase FtsW [Defluviitaleaceae bacterium]